MKTRKWHQRPIIIFATNIALFIFVVIFYEIFTYSKSVIESKNTSFFVEPFLWNIDEGSAEQYLKVYLENKNIHSIKIYHPDNSPFLELENTQKETIISNLLRLLFLIRNYKISEKIFHQNEYIGKIEIEWINENIYIYFYLSIIFILLGILGYFYVKIIEQRDKISDALKHISELKTQQDADYYLTSLLIEPLKQIQKDSQFYQIEFYLEQKKKFSYKHWQKEIGGYFIITKKIYLRNRSYVFFIDSDAMGKSLQGGSGSLVLGSLCYAILRRIEFKEDDKNKYPETFLKYTALEIQELFESFDGSMLVSAVIGLIDEISGILYFINFEHPYPILYRQNKAQFFGEDFILRKLGTPKMFQQNILIQVLELEEKDVIFVGSDGKDDIELTNSKGEHYVNEDETLILKNIEKNEGALDLIIQEIKNSGKLIDDISLMSFHCLEKRIPLIDNIPANDTKNLKPLIKEMLSKESDFQRSYAILKIYVEEYPIDIELLYYYCQICEKLKRYKEAIEIGERILNRKMDFPFVYYPLIRSYITTGNLFRSSYLIEELKKTENDKKKLENFIQRIEDIKNKIKTKI